MRGATKRDYGAGGRSGASLGWTECPYVLLQEQRESMLLQSTSYRSVRDKIVLPNVLMDLFTEERQEDDIHLEVQAGVWYSIGNLSVYLESDTNGTFELLEAALAYLPTRMLLASSSSRYGANENMPYQEPLRANHQMSCYAATKKSTNSYVHLFNLTITNFRIFTVYGTWGRPEMALFKFTEAILKR
ncbi:NAD-dependent epimerase/dehydratase family protein [Alphaproteobacteria bacterium]|nr:NAD-dependent epimerase/dehydratase family protein [Alphaproteobacteria bacterium]